jgi:very-short-patch-repair endonuclease
MSDKQRIEHLLKTRPGLKAQEIAAELSMDKSHVATALHSFNAGEVVQDSNYRWWPQRRHSSRAEGARQVAPHPFLSQLCRYYLDCLAHESGSGVSLDATAEGEEYVTLCTLPFGRTERQPAPNPRAIRRIVQKVRRERGQLTLYVGYGLRVRPMRVRDHEVTRLEPVLLYPLEDSDTVDAAEQLQPASAIPLFNVEVLKNLPSVDSGNLIDEAIQLSEELGLANLEDDLPPWDEIILRLQHRRPDWDWQEALNPYQLSVDPPTPELHARGIFNRAILFAGTRSPFTYGLENELRKMAQLDAESIRGTALEGWLRGAPVDSPPVQDRPIVEILPLNTEQRQAVVQGLSAPLTVVTGPPGTGKSQVVTSLLVNQAWHMSSVLFSSRNNHAVDVVEERVNSLGPAPLLLRLGKEEHHAQLAQQLTATLAESSTADDETGYAWQREVHDQMRARFNAVQEQIAAVVALRNHVDELERAAEPARALFPGDRFAALRSLDLGGIRTRLAARENLQAATARGVWDAVTGRRSQAAAELNAELTADAAALGLTAPAPEMLEQLEWAERVQAYLRVLDELRSAPSLEGLAQELTHIADESAQNSRELWQSWLRLRPRHWTPEQRKLLGEYVSLLQMIAGGDRYEEGAGRRVFRRYYTLFADITRILPCWAVTTLSARGRLPFQAGLFDLVVIDEASQCDIASALPLLFRAKRAVIIGDPLQLKHVSTVVPQQDRLLFAARGLVENAGIWAYTVNSLFDLARSICRHEDLVNLRDHHRSHRDIIAFSNQHFYRGRLRVVTDHDSLARSPSSAPAVRWIEIRGKVMRPAGGGAMNTLEAEALLKAVRSLVLSESFTGSIGVVTPFRAQANRIRALVHQDRDLAQKLAALRFVVDTVHGFQGDERDVIFFSPVVSAGINDTAIRFLKGNGNLFNVAITRARAELVIVGDRQAALNSGVSYLAGFAEYVHDLATRATGHAPSGELGPDYPTVPNPEQVSEWERIFYRALYQAGLRPVPQYEEAPFVLDFAVFQDDRKLDIEIDGENYHRHWDGELSRRDQIRSRRLADAGWDILRFWVYEVRDDLPSCIERVRNWVSASSIR